MKRRVDKIKKLARQRFEQDETYHLSSLRFAPEMSAVIYEINRAFEKGIQPETVSSHVYFLKDGDERPLGVFKTNRFLKEYAAFRLDHHHFADVPSTVITTLKHPQWEEKKRDLYNFS